LLVDGVDGKQEDVVDEVLTLEEAQRWIGLFAVKRYVWRQWTRMHNCMDCVNLDEEVEDADSCLLVAMKKEAVATNFEVKDRENGEEEEEEEGVKDVGGEAGEEVVLGSRGGRCFVSP
jgi:hypothetical protein